MNFNLVKPLIAETRINDLVADESLKKVTVIGAGAMGSGIAALVASAGIPVRLLDVGSNRDEDRNSAALRGIERQLAAQGFLHPSRAKSIEVGNLDDDLRTAGDSDWIVEAIIENLETKRGLYARLETIKKPDALVTSNTSTIPIRDLVVDRAPEFREKFLVTHFFNPPRRMPLLEIVCGADTSGLSKATAAGWGQKLLGKQVVVGRDTPGFIANRIGNYWMSVAALEAIQAGLSVSEADAIVGSPFGIPRTGVFGLFDYVGINLVPLVWRGLLKMLPASDAHQEHNITTNRLFAAMLDRGYTGRFGPSGFYRRKSADGTLVREMIDLATGEYIPLRQASVEVNSLRELCARHDAVGRYAWRVLSHTIRYVAGISREIAEDLDAIDVAMRTGYNWRHGPFELADDIGVAWIAERLRLENQEVPELLRQAEELGSFAALKSQERNAIRPNVLTLAAIKRKNTQIFGNDSASIWDLGDGVACFEIHTKLNVCDQLVVDALAEACRIVPRDHLALVIGSDNERAFSAGAKLDIFIGYVKTGDWNGLRAYVSNGQRALLDLKYAAFPVVAAAAGLALGGGCELMLHCDQIVAHAELQAGFPEINAGIIPGWGGGTQLLLRHLETGLSTATAATHTFDVITSKTISSSALYAREYRILRPTDHIIMSRDHLIAAAKGTARALAKDYTQPAQAMIPVAGALGLSELQQVIDRKRATGTFTDVDVDIAKEFAFALSGSEAAAGARQTEQQLMKRELNAILNLAKRTTTLARLEHLRATNKPLRN